MAFYSNTRIILPNANCLSTKNVLIGCAAGLSLTTGIDNTVIGGQAGLNLVASVGNTLVGGGMFLGTGNANTHIGNPGFDYAGSGGSNVTIGSCVFQRGATQNNSCSNVAIGSFAAYNNTGDANNNTLIGNYAGVNLTTGANNLLVGYCAGIGITSGSGNTIIGFCCPIAITTNNCNLLISWGCCVNTGPGGIAGPSGWIYGTSVGFSIGNTTPVASVGLNVTGEVVATTDITAYYSDRRLKENIIIIDCALDKINSLTGVKYTANDLAKKYGFENEKEQLGLLADEVEKVLPEAIALAPFDADENNNSISGENYLTVKYEKITPLIIEAIKELDLRLSLLNEKIMEI